MKIADLTDRAQRLENFTRKLLPASKIRPYMEGYLLQTIDEMTKAGKTADASALTAKFRELFPNSKSLELQAFTAALQSKDYAKATEIGEKLYAAGPDPQIAEALRQAYIAANNGPKAAEYTQKVLDSVGPKDGSGLLVWLADYYTGQRNLEQALTYYDKLFEAFPDAPPAGWDAQQWNGKKANAFALRGNLAQAKKDCDGVIANFTESLKYFAQNDVAYFLMGRCYWQAQKLDQAEECFAKSVVLGKATAAKAREYLEQIWKPRHGGTTDGLDALLAKAKTELRL
jgi:tetratricopeptide (TPR) repeat protein